MPTPASKSTSNQRRRPAPTAAGRAGNVSINTPHAQIINTAKPRRRRPTRRAPAAPATPPPTPPPISLAGLAAGVPHPPVGAQQPPAGGTPPPIQPTPPNAPSNQNNSGWPWFVIPLIALCSLIVLYVLILGTCLFTPPVLKNIRSAQQNVSGSGLPGLRMVGDQDVPLSTPAAPPAPIPINYVVRNITRVKVENDHSPGAIVNVATATSAGSSAPTTASAGNIWYEQAPTRTQMVSEEMPSDSISPGENVAYNIPEGDTITPMPEGWVPDGVVQVQPMQVQSGGYDPYGRNWQTGGIRVRISPDWHGGPIRLNFNPRHGGQPFNGGFHSGGFQGGQGGFHGGGFGGGGGHGGHH